MYLVRGLKMKKDKKLPEWQRASLDLISIPFIILKTFGFVSIEISIKILKFIRSLEE